MGLFSRFRATPAPAAPAGQWRRGEVEVAPLGEDATAVWLPGQAPHVLPAFAVEFALECREFAPLGEHVHRYAEQHGWEPLQTQALQAYLPALTAAGALVSTTQLTGGQHPASGATITALGVITGGTRSALLERTLRSLAENLHHHGRTAEFLVADNSHNPAHAAACAAHLAAWQSALGQRVLFAGPEEKRRFAAALVAAGACSPATAEFALFDPLQAGFACGNNRNALLLHAAGQAFSSMDDDVICRFAAPPEAATAPLACASNQDFTARWLYPSRAATLQAARWQEVDYLALHERLLGRATPELFAAAPGADFSQAGTGLVKRLTAGPAQVRATFPGHLGDPGIPTSAYFLYYRGASQERLTASAAHYASVFGSRSVLATVTAPTLADASTCPGMAMGLDHRTLLPPFCPVLHAEDFSFGAALWQCCPDALLGHLPAAIYHEPGEGKPILTPAEVFAQRPFIFFEFAHLLRQLILELALPAHATTEARMVRLGQELLQYGQLTPADFQELLRHRALLHAGERLTFLQEQLDEFPDAPDFWRQDVQALRTLLRTAPAEPDFELPLDLRARPEAHAFLQRLLHAYGELLRAWPAMVAAAQTLRASGLPLMRPV